MNYGDSIPTPCHATMSLQNLAKNKNENILKLRSQVPFCHTRESANEKSMSMKNPMKNPNEKAISFPIT